MLGLIARLPTTSRRVRRLDDDHPAPYNPSVLKQIFTWWTGATIGARAQIGRTSQFVGEDDTGNKYYESVAAKFNYDGRNRRFVIYKLSRRLQGAAGMARLAASYISRAADPRAFETPRLGEGRPAQPDRDHLGVAAQGLALAWR